ncbi:MAG TPA: hypothetical protein VFN88_08445 [Caulobacteraceae bacterium]|nr:hypothetical protein [Caulobacteraceae bacterium]
MTAVIVLAAVVATAAILSESISAALVRSDPQAAAAWGPGNSEAAFAAANHAVGEALTGSEIDEATGRAARALRSSPLSAANLRVLAQAYQLKGDDGRAHALMELAGRRSFRDTPAQLWLFQEDLSAGRFDKAFVRADLMLRRNPDLEGFLFPAMVSRLDAPAARTAMLDRLRRGPNWRPSFIQGLAQGGEQGGVAPWLLTNLTSSPNPPTPQEIAFVSRGFIGKGDWAAARAWSGRFRASNEPLLFDGDFEQTAREPPFGWRFEEKDGAVASIEPLDGGHSLFAQFPVGRSAPLAEMLMLLQPGHYRLSGRFKVDQLPAGAVFRWTASCAESGATLLSWDANQTSGWRRLDAQFDIPADGCAAQWLRLAGNGGEGYLPASSWYDDLRLERAP